MLMVFAKFLHLMLSGRASICGLVQEQSEESSEDQDWFSV